MRPETLRSWHSLGLLGIMALAAIGPTAGTAEGISARRARIEQMSAAEKQLLREKKDRFDQLTEHEQDKLRLIHNQLEGDPDSERLTRVMENYFEWLKTLSPGQRAELLELGVDERIARVKFFHQEQQSQYFRRLIATQLPAADGRAMFAALERAVPLLAHHYGPDHVDVAKTLTNLGNAYGDFRANVLPFGGAPRRGGMAVQRRHGAFGIGFERCDEADRHSLRAENGIEGIGAAVLLQRIEAGVSGHGIGPCGAWRGRVVAAVLPERTSTVLR